tara:strand:+ start:42 stop:746 length:705 start_codon:yes stop_codon:yes gene_type:complete
MSTSKFSQPFMKKSPVTPLQGNAFIKAKIDAEKAGKTSFSFNGRNYPVKMKSDSPANNNHNEDPKKIIGEQTFEFEQDKPSGNYVAGLSLDGGSAEPEFTDDRIVITPKQKKKMEKGGKMYNNFIDQMEKMTIKKDSVSGGKNFYSPVKNIDPKKKKAYQDSIQKLHKPAYKKYVKQSKEGFYIDDTDGAGPKTFVKPRTPKSLKDFAYDMEIAKGGSVKKDGVPASKLARMYK